MGTKARLNWGIESAYAGQLEMLTGMQQHWPKQRPNEGDVLTLPFIVDPVSRQPVPVQVTRVIGWTERVPPLVTIVLAPARPQ